MNRLKILLLVKRFQFGGAENHVCELANSLAAGGHQVWLLSGGGSQVCRLHPGVRHRTVRFSDIKLLFHLFFLIRLIRKEQIEVIHAHQRLPIFLGTLAAGWCKIPLVATVHGSPLTDLRSSRVRKQADRIIAIRESCRAGLQTKLGMASKVALIPNGINPPAFPVPRKEGRGTFSLFYISRIDRHHARLLKLLLGEVWPKLLDRHPGSVLHLVGEGTGFRRIKRFWQSRRFSPYRETVRLEGYCCEVPDFYAGADLVMGVGRVAIESLMYGIPLLSVKYNHLGEMVTRKNFGQMRFANFVDLEADPPTAGALFDRLNDFLERRPFYESEAAFLRQVVHREYNQADMVEKIVGVYREVI